MNTNVGLLEGLMKIGVHSKRVPATIRPDRNLHTRYDPEMERGLMQHGGQTAGANEAMHGSCRIANLHTMS